MSAALEAGRTLGRESVSPLGDSPELCAAARDDALGFVEIERAGAHGKAVQDRLGARNRERSVCRHHCRESAAAPKRRVAHPIDEADAEAPRRVELLAGEQDALCGRQADDGEEALR